MRLVINLILRLVPLHTAVQITNSDIRPYNKDNAPHNQRVKNVVREITVNRSGYEVKTKLGTSNHPKHNTNRIGRSEFKKKV